MHIYVKNILKNHTWKYSENFKNIKENIIKEKKEKYYKKEKDTSA